MMEGIFKFIAGPRREVVAQWLEKYNDPDFKPTDAEKFEALIYALDNGVIGLLEEIVREGE